MGVKGLLRLLTLSYGMLIENPRWLRDALDEQRRVQRRLARRVKEAAARMHACWGQNSTNMSLTFAVTSGISSFISWCYGLIALEACKLTSMLRNNRLSLSAHGAGLGIFQQLLTYKAESASSHFTLVDPAYTSQACSGCGVLVEKDLRVRVHVCPDGLLELDRGINGARKIPSLALNSARIEPSDVNVATLKGKCILRSPRIYPAD